MRFPDPKAALFSLLLLLAGTARAQLIVSDTLTTKAMLQTLFGGGVQISNITCNCDTTGVNSSQVSLGQFDGTATNLGLTTGVILSTGVIANAVGPNISGSTGTSIGTPGDPLLTTISGQNTFDACRISFTMIPDCDTIAIKYVFASDEYPEFVNSINDVFAFFITGANPAGGTWTNRNIALVPGTNTAVTINNVNNLLNSQYYVNNNFQGAGTGTTIEYDGFTTPLYASSAVVACSTYQVVIAVADASDGVYDSAVFLEAGGISCSSPPITIDSKVINPIFGDNVGIEGCLDGQITLKLTKPVLDTTFFTIGFSGTATPGLDYTQPNSNIMFVPGLDSINLYMPILRDSLLEIPEYVVISYADTFGCDSTIFISRDTLFIYDAPVTSAGIDRAFCSGDTIAIGVQPDSGETYLWLTTTGLSATNIPDPVLTLVHGNPSQPQTYIYRLQTAAYQGACLYIDSTTITVYPKPQADFRVDTACFGKPTTFTDITLADSVAGWQWLFGDLTSAVGVQDTTHIYQTSQPYTATLIATSRNGCTDTVSRTVRIHALPVPAFTAPPVCFNAPSLLQATTPQIATWNWNLVEATRTVPNVAYTFSAPDTYAVQLTVTDINGCVDSLTQDVVVYPLPVPGFVADSACFGQPTHLSSVFDSTNRPIVQYNWTFGEPGAIGTGINSEYIYTSPGEKTVSITYTDDRNCVDTRTALVRVWGLPAPSFVAPPVCDGNPVVFANTTTAGSSESVVGYVWWMDDGTTYTTTNPSHLFTGIDDHLVTLVAISNRACTDTFSMNAVVYPNPIASFEMVPDCPLLPIPFTDLSTVVPGQYNSVVSSQAWTFGDGQTGGGTPTTHAYANDGQYTVTLIVSTNNGCRDTLFRELTVFPAATLPVIAEDSVCFGDQALLMVQLDTPSVQARWFVAPESPAAFHAGLVYQTPSVIVPQTYWVEAATANECLSEKVPIRALLHPNVTGQIVPQDPRIEFPEPTGVFLWEGNSTSNSYLWTFGEKDTSHQAEPSYRFPQPGIYTITAEVTSPEGCTGIFSTTAEVVLSVRTLIPSIFTPNADGTGDRLTGNIALLQEMRLVILDRWGTVIYETVDPAMGWDGTYKGSPVPEGTYLYHLTGADVEGRIINERGTIVVAR